MSLPVRSFGADTGGVFAVAPTPLVGADGLLAQAPRASAVRQIAIRVDELFRSCMVSGQLVRGANGALSSTLTRATWNVNPQGVYGQTKSGLADDIG